MYGPIEHALEKSGEEELSANKRLKQKMNQRTNIPQLQYEKQSRITYSEYFRLSAFTPIE